MNSSVRISRAHSYINTTKFINALETTGIFNTGNTWNSENPSHVRVLFNDHINGSGRYSSQYNINILDVRLLKDGQMIKRVDFKDIINIVGLNPWLNVGHQLNKVKNELGITKVLDAIDIDIATESFMNNKGQIINYHPIKYVKIKRGEGNTNLMNKLIKEVSEARIKWFNDKWRNKSGEDVSAEDSERPQGLSPKDEDLTQDEEKEIDANDI